MKRFDYSIIVPVYNSESSLNALFERISAVFNELQKTFRVIFVNDASEDGSWKVILELKGKFPEQIKAINLSKNFGQQKATLCGIHHSAADFIITIDDDLQNPPEEIIKLIQTQKETDAELVYGIFDLKKHSVLRSMGSRFVNIFFHRFANTSGKGSSFRLITGEVAEKLVSVNQKYLLLDEVLNWFTNNIARCKVEHAERTAGRSNYNLLKLILITFSYVVNYTIIPLRLMTYVGFFVSLITFIIGLVYIYQRFFDEVALGFTSLIVAIFFSTSIILFSLGIIGEYISRIYVKEGGQPPYLIKEIR